MAKAILQSVKGDTSGKTNAKELLTYNEMKALSHILAMEEHLAELTPEQSVHSWCLVKHDLLLCEHALLEAISHSERAGKDPEVYRRFRQKILDLNVYPKPHISIKDLAKLRTEWRRIIKDPTLSNECPLCSSDIEELRQLLPKTKTHNYTSLTEIEEQMADKMLAFLSKKYDVPKPTLEITPECNDPNKGVHKESWLGSTHDKIILCKGNVTLHVLVHEFEHYLNHVQGKPQDETEVEQKALREFQFTPSKNLDFNENHLYTSRINNYIGGRKMAWETKEGLAIFGGQLVDEGITGFESNLEASIGADMVSGVEIAGGGAAFFAGVSGKIGKRGSGLDLFLMTVGAGLVAHGAMRLISKFTAPAGVGARFAAPVSGGSYIPSPTVIAGRASMIGATPGAMLSAPVPGTRMYGGITRLTAGFPGVAKVDGEKYINIKV